MIFFVTLKFLIVSVLAGRAVTAMAPLTFQIHPNGNKTKRLNVLNGGAVFSPVNMSAIISEGLSPFLTCWQEKKTLDPSNEIGELKTIWVVGKITYLKCFGVNLITYPSVFFCLGRKVLSRCGCAKWIL